MMKNILIIVLSVVGLFFLWKLVATAYPHFDRNILSALYGYSAGVITMGILKK